MRRMHRLPSSVGPGNLALSINTRLIPSILASRRCQAISFMPGNPRMAVGFPSTLLKPGICTNDLKATCRWMMPWRTAPRISTSITAPRVRRPAARRSGISFPAGSRCAMTRLKADRVCPSWRSWRCWVLGMSWWMPKDAAERPPPPHHANDVCHPFQPRFTEPFPP